MEKLCSIHKYNIPCGPISKIDRLEAGSNNCEDPSLIRSVLVVKKFLKITFAHQNMW